MTGASNDHSARKFFRIAKFLGLRMRAISEEKRK
jgi:hypothetical protein